MLVSDIGNRPGKLHIFQYLIANHGMPLDQLKFHGTDATRLAQNLGGHLQLADIVNGRTQPDPFNMLMIQPHLLGYGPGQA